MFANPLARDTDYVGDAGRHINISFGQFITAHKNHYDWNVRHPRTFHWRDLLATPTTLPSSLYRVHNYLLMDYDLSHVLFGQTNKIIFNTRTRTTSGQSDGMQHPVYSKYPPGHGGPSKANKTNIPVWINRWAHPQALSRFYNVLPS